MEKEIQANLYSVMELFGYFYKNKEKAALD